MSVIWFAIVILFLIVGQMQFFHYWGLRRIQYRRYFSRNSAYEGEKVDMVEVLTNNKPIPLPWLKVESKFSSFLRFKRQEDFDISYDQFHSSVFYMRGYKRITRRHEITCTHRGYYKMGNAAISAGDLFGLLNKFTEVPSDSVLYVYPQPLEPAELSISTLKWQGDVVMRRWIMPDPILINGIREYRYGDSLKDVHWAATARTGNLQVKVHDFTVSPKILIVLNTQPKEDMFDDTMNFEDSEKMEYGVRLSAHLATWAINNGLECGFYCNGKLSGIDGIVEVPAACSQAHLEELLMAMARLELVRERNFHTMLDTLREQSVTGMDILVVSAYWSNTLEGRADRLRLLGNNVSHLLFSGDEFSPYQYNRGEDEPVDHQKEAV